MNFQGLKLMGVQGVWGVERRACDPGISYKRKFLRPNQKA